MRRGFSLALRQCHIFSGGLAVTRLNFVKHARIHSHIGAEGNPKPSSRTSCSNSCRAGDRRLVKELAANWQSLKREEDPRVDSKDRSRFLGAWNEDREILGYTLLGELPYALKNSLQNYADLEGVDYDLLIVDEYQDLNACDLELLRLISERGCSVIGAGRGTTVQPSCAFSRRRLQCHPFAASASTTAL